MPLKLRFLLVFLAVTGIPSRALFAQSSARYKKLPDGVIVYPEQPVSAHAVRLVFLSDKIVHVSASPADSFPDPQSLMVIDRPAAGSVKWTQQEVKDRLLLRTDTLAVEVSLVSGRVQFLDKTGRPVLGEAEEGTRFTPAIIEGKDLYRIRQVFDSPPDECLYGLGEHQSGLMNYKDQRVDLIQNNSEAVVPFVVSTRNYGILWDNYSITRFGDTRDYENLSAFRLFDAGDQAGGLTATYSTRTAAGTDPLFAKRTETGINYEFLSTLQNLPKGFDMAHGEVRWEGSIEPAVTGSHKFLLKSGGYVKLWIDGKILVDKWRQCWNPGTSLIRLPLEKGKKYHFKLEWIPDGNESFISLKWMGPIPPEEQDKYAFSSQAGEQADYYFVYGKDLDEVIGGYRRLTGKAPIMPQWALGLWQSRERYKTQEELLSVVKEFRQRKIPLDNIVQDWFYWKPDQWGSQEFDSSRFPDPGGMISRLHTKYHTHFMISVWPKFYMGTHNYQLFNEKGWLYTRNIQDHQKDWVGYVSTFYDAFNPQARQLFWKLIHKNLFDLGVDAWWLDATEPDILSNSSPEHRKALMNPTALGPAALYFNAYPIENARAVYEGQRKADPDKRVFILTRSAYGGLQRYSAATWSGDIGARWHDLRTQIPVGLNFSLSGIPYWTMDIGGFAVEHRYEDAKGKDLEEWRELMTRWYQFGAFCPLFRVHGQYPYREIFNVAPPAHPAYQSMLYYDRLRYRLLPYIYTLAARTWYDNYTIMRALVMDFPSDTAVRRISDQYMFGPSLLVNPVCEYKARSRSVYLPAGTGWYDFYTGRYFRGAQHITADAPYTRMPLYVKEGSILPFGPAIQYTGEKKADTITLYVYTGKDAAFSLYEDEDTNYNYEKGAYARIPMTYREKTKTLTIGRREGTFPGMPDHRVFRVVWVTPDKPAGVRFNGPIAATLAYAGKEVRVKKE